MPLVFLSAPSGLGKTTACTRLLALARQEGFDTAGFLSLPVFEGGEKTAIHLQNAATGERRLFARRALPGEETDIGYWRMDEGTTAWANRVFEGIQATDLLFVDEIGPLELVHKRGLTQALHALETAAYRLAVAAIRPSLLETLQDRLHSLSPASLVLTRENREQIPRQLLRIFLQE